MMVSRLMSAVMVVMMVSVPAIAAECVGVTHPGKAVAGGAELTLNGLGLREATLFKVDVYVAALYLEKRLASGKEILDSAGPKKLVLKFVRDVSKDEISGAWSEGFEKTAGGDLEKLMDRIAKLNGWMTDMTSGDSLTFTYMAKTATDSNIEINVNGIRKGTIPGNDFAKAFFAIWLGSEPPNEGLKTGLLGGSCG